MVLVRLTFLDNFYKLGQMQMEVGFGIEVSEVPFDLFERRKVTRKNSAFNEALTRIEVGLGYEVREVAFDEFERRKTPRVISVNVELLT